jgi:hypothetical protein
MFFIQPQQRHQVMSPSTCGGCCCGFTLTTLTLKRHSRRLQHWRTDAALKQQVGVLSPTC